MWIELDDQEVFEAFKNVAERCGIQFSGICTKEYFTYFETGVLWELFKRDPEYVTGEYINIDVAHHKVDMYYDQEIELLDVSDSAKHTLRMDKFVEYDNALRELLSYKVQNWL